MLSVAVLVKAEPFFIRFTARSSGLESGIVHCRDALCLVWAHPRFASFRLITSVFIYRCWVWHSTVREFVRGSKCRETLDKTTILEKTLGTAFHHFSLACLDA